MVDDRFFRRAGPFTLQELAELAGAEIAQGSDPARRFSGVAPLSTAGAEDLSFLDNPHYAEDFRASAAGGCIVAPEQAGKAPAGMALLLASKPYRGYAAIAAAFHPGARPSGQIDANARIGEGAEIGEGTEIGPGAVVDARAVVGDRCWIAANAVIGPGVVIGDDSVVGAGATLSHCLIGARVNVHPGVRIGQRGFGFDMSDFPFRDVPQLGRVIVEDDVEIGANTTIDRGAGPDTVIGAGCKLDNLVQIGHNVRLGRGCVVVAQAGIAGSTVIEDFVAIGGQAGLNGHLRVGKGAQIAAQSGVARDVQPGERVAGTPAMPAKQFFRLVGIWHRLLKTKGTKDE
ncbi:UDP-3-O-(3-hydroxymyristoyl)glucosamine N-acyltransferase [Rhodovibrio sodomensis]|uniref:UDP-3-O-acylglucosamine N-acyltransferase n=1 Tax=Rhodovibrio sodomensis TaxID=1088 RepID=A0ABS1DHD0_9PROT|nr:UDP-3-O-(3-hydroxymyristoyl)glucosamine N-acyltransferase [Rhodovibrio sodomensis]MBK1669143.1 UDP-3-O-(3-hydroxymyristoyl)glucosamine N-acyltransferase [Rhodovibrio sodomensis]